MINFTFEFQGVPQFNRSFNRVAETVSDLRPVWHFVELAFRQIEEDQFKSEGAIGKGGHWAALTPGYAISKAQAYPGAKILERTGRLRKSLAGTTGDSVKIVEKLEFAIGTSVPYAGYHQSGTSKMAARPPIDFGEGQKEDMQKMIQRGLLEVVRADREITSVLEVE